MKKTILFVVGALIASQLIFNSLRAVFLYIPVDQSTIEWLLWAWVPGLLVACLLAAAIPQIETISETEWAHPLRAKVARVVIALTLILLVGSTVGGTVRVLATVGYRDSVRAEAAALAPACASHAPVSGTTAYGGAAPHPLAVLGNSGQAGDWTVHAIDLGWQPRSIDTVQLVICLGDDSRHQTGQCNYEGGATWTDYQHSRDVRLVEAASGRQIDIRTFQGPEPSGGCPATTTSGGGESDGGWVGWDSQQIWDYIAGWKGGTAEPGSSPS